MSVISLRDRTAARERWRADLAAWLREELDSLGVDNDDGIAALATALANEIEVRVGPREAPVALAAQLRSIIADWYRAGGRGFA